MWDNSFHGTRFLDGDSVVMSERFTIEEKRLSTYNDVSFFCVHTLQDADDGSLYWALSFHYPDYRYDVYYFNAEGIESSDFRFLDLYVDREMVKRHGVAGFYSIDLSGLIGYLQRWIKNAVVLEIISKGMVCIDFIIHSKIISLTASMFSIDDLLDQISFIVHVRNILKGPNDWIEYCDVVGREELRAEFIDVVSE